MTIRARATRAALLGSVVFGLATTPFAVSCNEDAASGPPPPLTIGTLSSVSGDLASVGTDFNAATQLAIDDINQNGGVLGRFVKLEVRDDGTTPEGAKAGFGQLRALRVPVILGPTTSPQVSALAETIAVSDTVTIGRTTTADQLTDLEDNGYFFRLAPADVFQAGELAKLVVERRLENGVEKHAEHLCLIHRGDIYGNNLARSVKKRLEGSGTEIIESQYDPSISDLSSVMSPCSSLVCPDAPSDSGADSGPGCSAPPPEKVGLMLLTFIEDGALILNDAKARGWSARKSSFFLADGGYDRALIDRVRDPANIEGALGTAPAGPNPALADGEIFRRFEAAFADRYKRIPSIFIENAYDSMYVAAIAIEIAKTDVPGPAIREAMKQVSVPGGVRVEAGDWKTILETIREGKPIDFQGASGGVEFDEKGDIKPPYNYVIWKIAGGKLVEERREVVN